MLLWTWGGTVYFFMEVIWKTFSNHPERIHWSMLLIAILLCAVLERGGAQCPWEMPLTLQAFLCTVLIIVVELLSGIVLNIWLNLNIWDYSHLWGNFMGQICPQFCILWYFLCLIFIPVFDYLRYSVEGGEKPHYTLI